MGHSHCLRLSFNPRLRTGGDTISVVPPNAPKRFQSTPPHGRRLTEADLIRRQALFQSTPPHGRRQNILHLI